MKGQEPTHRDLARAATEWLLSQRWCESACFELGWTGGVLDAVGCTGPSTDEKYRVAMERWGRWNRSAARYGHSTRERPRPVKHRLQVVEVKRTRADLMGDLRRGKMLGYEARSTHCVLACWEGCFPGCEGIWSPAGRKAMLADLAAMGLPARWGVLAFYQPRYGGTVPLAVAGLRRPTRLRDCTRADREALLEAMARSYAYRVLRGAVG